ncbi:O-methyltransferase [Virgisporangium aurantiacum]|uniref:O-methyltransferase n=1 Tax=Virgisporangium aurantiacum TaxID=175570 RepID=A0A8J4E488_9ACTN|nr:class I SAM-dependent methyltransferase [Virgisporangium aurantiacum]GIJ60819.1 O-methyltransferase [Virgisporangium aurantiacum]
MDAALRTLLDGLYADGTTHDEAQPDRLRRRRNLEPGSAELLTLVLRVAGARDVVEIGTSNAYSAIWLADAVRDTGGHVLTVDVEEWPGAAENLARAGVEAVVDRRLGDGGELLAGLPDASVDLLFLDAERVEYPNWWPHPVRVLRPGAVLAVDNVLSHPDEVAPFLALVEKHGGFESTTATVGKGLYLAWYRP